MSKEETLRRVQAAALDGRTITVVRRNGDSARGRVLSRSPRGLQVSVEFDTPRGVMGRLVTLETFLGWNPSFGTPPKGGE